MIVVGLCSVAPEVLAGIAEDVAFLATRGDRMVVVHGAAGDPGEDPIPALLAGNKRVVSALQSKPGIRAVGISGADGRLLEIRTDGDPSSLPAASPELCLLLLRNRFVPVVASAALREGVVVAVPVEDSAASLAGALSAEALVLLGEEPGLLEVEGDIGSLRKSLTRAEAEDAARVPGPLASRLLAGTRALRGGVSRIVLGQAGIPSPVLRALEGRGTVIR